MWSFRPASCCGNASRSHHCLRISSSIKGDPTHESSKEETMNQRMTSDAEMPRPEQLPRTGPIGRLVRLGVLLLISLILYSLLLNPRKFDTPRVLSDPTFWVQTAVAVWIVHDLSGRWRRYVLGGLAALAVAAAVVATARLGQPW